MVNFLKVAPSTDPVKDIDELLSYAKKLNSIADFCRFFKCFFEIRAKNGCRYATAVLKTCSTILAEVRQTQMCGCLLFSLLACAGHDKYQNGNDIRQTLEELLRGTGKVWNVEIHPVQNAEQIGAPNGVDRLPGGEDNQRNGKPAESFHLT